MIDFLNYIILAKKTKTQKKFKQFKINKDLRLFKIFKNF